MSDALCTKYGCDYQLDLDGQFTCINCGAMGDDMPNPNNIDDCRPNINNLNFETQRDFE
jgi:transcription initiation factor IIE alpha subunit